jgi:hypothetical protein
MSDNKEKKRERERERKDLHSFIDYNRLYLLIHLFISQFNAFKRVANINIHVLLFKNKVSF